MSDRGIVSVEASHKVVLENAKSKLGVNNGSCKEEDHSHKPNNELQSCLDELHCSKLSKSLKQKKHSFYFHSFFDHLGCQVECVEDIDAKEDKKEGSKPATEEDVNVKVSSGKPVVVSSFQLPTKCRVSNFIELLGYFHSQRREPHWEHN